MTHVSLNMVLQGVHYVLCFFSLPPIPRQRSAAIGCTKKYQSIGVYTRIALRALKVSYSDVGEGAVAVNCEKTQFFLNTLYNKGVFRASRKYDLTPNLLLGVTHKSNLELFGMHIFMFYYHG